jgi:ectoine hydroxylase-related dioxygenase (phytanoyl-CoA dioxygenase family)
MAASAGIRFDPIDFERYHREELPALLAAGRSALAARAAGALTALAFRRREGGAYTYRRAVSGIEVIAGDAAAETVIEIDHGDWEGLVHELEAPAGLLYAGRVSCPRGRAMDLMAWEPSLRALYNGRAPYDPAEAARLQDRHGAPLDPEAAFTLASEREDMAHFLRTVGYLFVRDVFDGEEIQGFLADAAELRREARKGDKLSWWGKHETGDELLCRVTRGRSKPHLGSLPDDPRVRALKDLADEPLVSQQGEGDGMTVIWKQPGVAEGMGDLPWHRDCGMGGHASRCPTLVCSVFLTDSTPETGELVFLPGSWQRSAVQAIFADEASAPRGAHFRARPGDVSIHYGDTLHAAPPPGRSDLDAYRVSAVLGFARPDAYHHRGEQSYNAVLHRREDGQIEHLARRTEQR